MIGHDIAKKAIERRYDIVTEMIGEVPDDIAAVSAAMRKAGYRIQAECLTCDIAVAQERNLQRGPDNISAYFTQHFHQKWLIAAANEFSRTQ
jgi:Zeta toxin